MPGESITSRQYSASVSVKRMRQSLAKIGKEPIFDKQRFLQLANRRGSSKWGSLPFQHATSKSLHCIGM